MVGTGSPRGLPPSRNCTWPRPPAPSWQLRHDAEEPGREIQVVGPVDTDGAEAPVVRPHVHRDGRRGPGSNRYEGVAPGRRPDVAVAVDRHARDLAHGAGDER